MSRFSRRALAPISSTLIEPASSIHSGADEIVPSDSVIRRQSSRLKCPVRNLCASICATDATRRCSSDSLDISRLNIATGCPPRIAMFSIRFSASAVFPCEGRAARINSSEGCSPDVSLSSSTYPVGIPVMLFPSLKILSRRSKLSRTMSLIGSSPARTRSSASAKIEDSAPSRIASAPSSPSNARC